MPAVKARVNDNTCHILSHMSLVTCSDVIIAPTEPCVMYGKSRVNASCHTVFTQWEIAKKNCKIKPLIKAWRQAGTQNSSHTEIKRNAKPYDAIEHFNP